MGYTIFYSIGKSLYVNLTNRCTNRCSFCIRETGGLGDGYDLWLEKEPTLEELIREFDKIDISKYDELVFCGYGEPLLRLDEVIGLSRHVKQRTGLKIRINTNGHANLIYNRDITPEFEGLIDCISVSLNAKNKQEYKRLCDPQYGEAAFDALIDFAKKCKNYVPDVVLTTVETVISPDDIEECRAIARNIGVKFRVRSYSG